MLRLPDHWVWDSWYADDEKGRHHAFFLNAPRALLDPDRRHRHASIGHAISSDLRNWQVTANALVAADSPAWDDLATWSGSVVRGQDRRWYLYYTGVSRADNGLVQRIGLATSTDLHTWYRHGDKPLVEADPIWYERFGTSAWGEEAWRDPWVFADPSGEGWHMLITARANYGPTNSRGVIGHAWSADLLQWDVRPPLTQPTEFGHLEVPQVAIVDGQPLLLFCTNVIDGPAANPADHIWTVPGPSVTGPWDMSRARPVLSTPDLYAPRLVRDSRGVWQLIGFLVDTNGEFIGELADPTPVQYTTENGLHRVITPC